MRQLAIFLAIGIAIGFFFGHRLTRRPAATDAASPAPLEKKSGRGPSASVREAPSLDAREPRIASPLAGLPARSAPTARRPEELMLYIDEGIVASWEASPESLHGQVYTTRDARGWRVHFLRGDNLFRPAGLRDGDLIDAQELGQQVGVVGSDLVERVRGVLSRLERR